ncbi:MAG: DUF167 domain-containing protein [Pseudomonadales bacterium]|nr:DUF167 domain-containing protein [Pseudomonadales bacterium]
MEVRVTAGVASNRLWVENAGTGRVKIKISVTAIAEKFKANAAVLALLSKKFGRPKGNFRLVRGKTSKNKLYEIVE